MTTLATTTHADVLDHLAACERGDGWLMHCEEAGRYLQPCAELIDALATQLRQLGDDPVLEVCAGDGVLSAALRDAGVPVTAVDRAPAGLGVQRMDAADALACMQPRVVMGSFIPFDAGVDRAVLASSSVSHYLVLNARLNSQLGDPAMWHHPAWSARPLPDVTRWMITRHDVWLHTHELIRHGEAWLLER